jgi:hypothetical protein
MRHFCGFTLGVLRRCARPRVRCVRAWGRGRGPAGGSAGTASGGCYQGDRFFVDVTSRWGKYSGCVGFLFWYKFLESHPWGNRRAVDLEKHSVAVSRADVLVGNGIRYASTFGCDRSGQVYGLCRRPFRVSQNPVHRCACHVRGRRHVSRRASFCPTAPRSFRPHRSPSS